MYATSRGGLRQLLHPYYIVNILLSCLFMLSKVIPGVCSLLYTDCSVDVQEYEILIFLSSFITIRNKRQFSVTDYVAHFCMFAKVCNVFMFGRQSLAYATVYGVLWIVQASFLFQPVYNGPASVSYFNEQTFNEVVICGDHRVTWIIAFYAAWSPGCNAMAPLFAELSLSYALPHLRFGKVDVTRSPNLARAYEIDTSTWSKQLPTIAIFRAGKEIDRRPGLSKKNKTPMKFNFSWDGIISAFSLNDVYTHCKNQQTSGKSD